MTPRLPYRKTHGWVSLLVLVISLLLYAQQQGWFSRAPTAVQPQQAGLYRVTRFVDGDTIVVDMNGTEEKVRLIGVALSGLTHGNEQLDLLDPDRRTKLDKLTRAADSLRDKFGFGKIQFGGSLRKQG